MKKAALLIIAVAAVGCSRSKAPDENAPANPDADIAIPESLIGDRTTANPAEVLVEVSGKSLTRGEAMRQVGLRLGGPPPADMPAGRQAIIRARVLSEVVEQFIKRTLLLAEADRLNIQATQDEIEKGMAAIKAGAPSNADPKGILAAGPAGDDSLKNEVIVGVRVEKLLASQLPQIDALTDDEVDAYIEEHRDTLTHPEKGLLPREQVKELMAAKARRQAVASYVASLLQNAELRHSSSVTIPKDWLK